MSKNFFSQSKSEEINSMLDMIDRAFSRVSEEPAVLPGPEDQSLFEYRAILERILADLAEMETLSPHREFNGLFLEFIAATRVRAAALARLSDEVLQPSSGPLEIEVDYAALHEFMLFPDLALISA